jgi:hypothetical protein
MSKRTPRLHFTEAELSAPEVKKAARKAGRASDRLDKAEAKIPKYQRSVRTVDPETGKVTVRLSFEEKKPPSKLIHAAKSCAAERCRSGSASRRP